MLGLTPDRRGLLPDADVKRIEEFGTARRERYAHNLVERRVRARDSIDAAWTVILPRSGPLPQIPIMH